MSSRISSIYFLMVSAISKNLHINRWDYEQNNEIDLLLAGFCYIQVAMNST